MEKVMNDEKPAGAVLGAPDLEGEAMFSKVERLKRQARKHYNAYQCELDKMSCGRAMGEQMNPRMFDAKQAFNRTMDELAQVDPGCPGGRL